MRVAVLEAVTAGLLGETPGESLLREGLAMWRGLLNDLGAVPGMEIETVCSSDFGEPEPDGFHQSGSQLFCRTAADAAAALTCWRAAVETADAAILIAPESDRMLTQLVAALPVEKSRFMSSVAAIELCTDKWKLFQHLQRAGVPTIPTVIEDWSAPPEEQEFPCVVKPIDGAGSWLVRLLTDQEDWRTSREKFLTAGLSIALRQPYLSGAALSIAGWSTGEQVEWLPVAEQHLTAAGTFGYQGGTVPARLPERQLAALRKLALQTFETVPGLRGYFGCDLILPDQQPTQPLLIEINPRFTSSYSGYRHAWQTSPWQRWLAGEAAMNSSPGTWTTVSFSAAGEVISKGQK